MFVSLRGRAPASMSVSSPLPDVVGRVPSVAEVKSKYQQWEAGAALEKVNSETPKQAVSSGGAETGINDSDNNEVEIAEKGTNCNDSSKQKTTSGTNATTCTTSSTVSSLVSSLSQSLKITPENQEKHKNSFLRQKNKPSGKRPFSSSGPQVTKMKENLERRSVLLNSDKLGSKGVIFQSPSAVFSKSKIRAVASSSEMSSALPIKLPAVTSPVKLHATASEVATTPANATELAKIIEQELKSPQESLHDSESGAFPLMSQSTATSGETEQSSPPTASALTPTSPSSKVAVTNHPKRLRSSKCREVWTLPSKGAPFMKTATIGDDVEETIILPQLLEDHWSKFPLRVRIVKGLLEEQLSNKNILDVHILKRTQVVEICDSVNQKFLIPHNSPIQFGIVYCPGVKNENYLFDKILDIIQAPDMPRVVTCTKKFKGKDDKSSLNVNEVLIVLEIIKGRKVKLKVFSFTEKKEKVLSADTVGKFTTDPKRALFYVPEILEYIPNPFPLSTRLFLDDEYDSLPDVFTKSPITMISSIIEDSVIGKLKDEEPQGGVNEKFADLVELPVVPDIIMSVIPESEMQLNTIEALYEDTLSMWKNLVAPSDGVPVCPRPQISGRTPLQNRLSTLYRKGEETKWSALEAPPLIKKDISTIQGSADSNAYQVLIEGVLSVNQYMQPNRSFSSSNSSYETNRSNSTTDDSDIHTDPDLEAFEKIMKSKRDMIREDPTDVQSSNSRLIRRIEAVESRVATAAPQTIINRLTRRVEALESKSGQRERKISQDDRTQIEDMKLVVEALQVSFKKLEAELNGMKAQLEQVVDEARRERKSCLHDETEAGKQKNIAILKSMDSNQILLLLDKLELNQYKEVFVEEAITGEILAECTESILAEDLDIKEASHCSKLMDIIHGNLGTRHLLDSIKASS